jgi:hypothetical protein
MTTAYLDLPQAIRRRRAFMHALVPLLGNDKALNVVALWEESLGSDQPLLRGIPSFAAVAAGELNLAVSPQDLTYALMQSLSVPESALPPDPKPILTSRVDFNVGSSTGEQKVVAPAAAAPAASAADPMVETLGTLVLAVVDALGRVDRAGQTYAVEQFLKALDKQAVHADFSNLLSGKAPSLRGKYDAKSASALLNNLYVEVATAAGPVSADRILTQAVAIVESSPAGFRYSPRQLL